MVQVRREYEPKAATNQSRYKYKGPPAESDLQWWGRCPEQAWQQEQ
jgi:hypothetical protein